MKLLNYVVAEDCGRIINPMIVDGQVHGAVAQGIGAALLEEIVYNDDGQLVTASLADYLLPLATDMPVSAGIAAERELMEPLRALADAVMVTTQFTPRLLSQAISENFGLAAGPAMTVTVMSFGFARGIPPVADFIFDMRFLENPHWEAALRPLTGKDARIGEFIRRDAAWQPAFVHIRDLLLTVLPRFAAQGKAYVTIAFGCTGGRHRSVFMAEQIAEALRGQGFSPTLLHRNLASRAADLIEGGLAR